MILRAVADDTSLAFRMAGSHSFAIRSTSSKGVTARMYASRSVGTRPDWRLRHPRRGRKQQAQLGDYEQLKAADVVFAAIACSTKSCIREIPRKGWLGGAFPQLKAAGFVLATIYCSTKSRIREIPRKG